MALLLILCFNFSSAVILEPKKIKSLTVYSTVYKLPFTMYTLTFYNVHAYLLQCTRLTSTMYTLTFYNVYAYLLQCTRLPSTMYMLTFYNVYAYLLQCTSLPFKKTEL